MLSSTILQTVLYSSDVFINSSAKPIFYSGHLSCNISLQQRCNNPEPLKYLVFHNRNTSIILSVKFTNGGLSFSLFYSHFHFIFDLFPYFSIFRT